MSAQPTATAPPVAKQVDLVNIEIDGKKLQVPKNSMIIQAADKAGIPIPRFCYHDKLPIAANCRMCMVETEMNGKPVPKPQPACATPVMEGMKVFTQSQRALSAQRNVMEFLLINHPLDCPICDQGGECELQDLSMGYGRSVSRFAERKRVIPDENLGPLISTDMTRCIQCTRCVRFMTEVAGSPELGGMGRGEMLEIGTYIGKTIDSELGGNIIDVCPVGALTNKVFRFKARAWELIARESIGYHDALGSNLWMHTRRGDVLRTVPRDNELINECWLSDRDRYSHQGLYADDRAKVPMIRKEGELVETTWEEAIAFVAEGLKKAGSDLGALVAPLTSSEEGYLLAKLVRALGSDTIDHRLRTLDFSDGSAGPTFEMPLADIEKADAIVIVGSNTRHEQPLLSHRIRKAWQKGAKVYAINPVDFDFNFVLAGKRIVDVWAMVDEVSALMNAPTGGENVHDDHRSQVKVVTDAPSSVVIFGDVASQSPNAAQLRACARQLARATNSAFNEIASGANDVGLARVGVVPRSDGKNAAELLANPSKNLIVYHAGSKDMNAPTAFDVARRNAEFCVYIGAYACNGVKKTAHAVLPIGLPPEIAGTYVNVDGTAQPVAAGSKLPGDAREGWRVLRALGAQLGLSEFGFTEYSELHTMVKAQLVEKATNSKTSETKTTAPPGDRAQGSFVRVATVPIYRADAVVRRAPSLQAHPLTGRAAVGLHPDDALALGLSADAQAKVSADGVEATLPVIVTRAVPRGSAWIESTWSETAALPPMGSVVIVARSSA
ncbi:MAG TPA: NADH-quinone oxidoreductase subunit NuoG [Rudaea sp.]|jgi:NADH-quinone oxidoreductase subunit G|nr:NADH-quinone oxidoreductase subunit NuoG [Rudaea sp.]